ncbi:hypothetical protein AM571_PC01419 (plasmid) [Rhizobium etli 8C-3]|uniref:Uncharacterized protein n=1 Tax=Rhizobium etli 8C-3 TaxID=538025 RepID=A0A1L5PG28_RHIET|nr:hypothetical protein AM571_PC01419 [Rhizobium etli 8C-3]
MALPGRKYNSPHFRAIFVNCMSQSIKRWQGGHIADLRNVTVRARRYRRPAAAIEHPQLATDE